MIFVSSEPIPLRFKLFEELVVVLEEVFTDLLRKSFSTPRQVKIILQVIGGTIPHQSNLHRWNAAPSPLCPLCQRAREGFTHIISWCNALSEANIAAHNKIWRKLVSLIWKYSDAFHIVT